MSRFTPMIEQYLAIKRSVPDTILFFRLGDFYEMFFEDAQLASRLLEITLTGRDGGGEERIPMCGVPYHSAHTYIARLIQQGYKVAICEQVEDPKSAKGVVRREVTRIITPGTIMDETVLDEKRNNFIAAVLNLDDWFCALCDVTTGEFFSFSVGNPERIWDEMIPFRPAELVMMEEIPNWNEEKIRAVLPCTISYYQTDDHTFDQWSAKAAKQFAVSQAAKSGHLIVAGFLLAYLESRKQPLDHIQVLQKIENPRYMIIDKASRNNLELTDRNQLQNANGKGTLLALLDQTVTAMGGRLLKKWLDKPLYSLDAINERLDGVAAFVADPLVLSETRQHLKQVYDIERLMTRVSIGTASAKDLTALASSLRQVPKIAALLQSSEQPKLRDLVNSMDECRDISELIDRSITDNPPVSIMEGGIIRSGYHPRVDQLREAKENGKRWIAELEQREKANTQIKSLKVGYNKVFGYYIEVTKSNLAQVPGHYTRRQTLANAERFITPELKEKEDLILASEQQLNDLEYELFQGIREAVKQEMKRVQTLAKQLMKIDVLQSLATVSMKHHYVRPEVRPEPGIWIEEGRHPVVEQTVSTFIANFTQLGGDRQIILITGPNMAGKSTYMRQVAMHVILAQMGCFVPAKRAVIGLVDKIFTRIGAADDLVGGQSTFMVEMSEIQHMLTNATARSLVIIDELGRGTSTFEGMAIAQSVIEYIHHHIGCLTLVSTHYHELASLAQTLERLHNYHMAVKEDGDNVLFLRKLVPGPADKSYGIYCAQIAGIPQTIIERAHELLNGYETREQLFQEAALSADNNEAAQLEEEQLNLFPEENDLPKPVKPDRSKLVLQRLKEADLMNMTPMQAMNFLHELKRKLH